jgi:hypothetical protein
MTALGWVGIPDVGVVAASGVGASVGELVMVGGGTGSTRDSTGG